MPLGNISQLFACVYPRLHYGVRLQIPQMVQVLFTRGKLHRLILDIFLLPSVGKQFVFLQSNPEVYLVFMLWLLSGDSWWIQIYIILSGEVMGKYKRPIEKFCGSGTFKVKTTFHEINLKFLSLLGLIEKCLGIKQRWALKMHAFFPSRVQSKIHTASCTWLNGKQRLEKGVKMKPVGIHKASRWCRACVPHRQSEIRGMN